MPHRVSNVNIRVVWTGEMTRELIKRARNGHTDIEIGEYLGLDPVRVTEKRQSMGLRGKSGRTEAVAAERRKVRHDKMPVMFNDIPPGTVKYEDVTQIEARRFRLGSSR